MSSSRMTRSRRRESGGEESSLMENPRVPEEISSPSVDPLLTPSAVYQLDLQKILSQQQEAARQQQEAAARQQQQLIQLLQEQQEQRRREGEARERSETNPQDLLRTTVAALQSVHQMSGTGGPAVTPQGSRVATPVPSPVPSPVPVPVVQEIRHPG
ncbi:putative cyclin-dependent serine/threonine-protein kinase DDB_G0272797/DDB_G0274007 [Neodiprion fabricii]|uniref:putative cyclin-dependent serine/threonine-protein kinase DDB_G0272797/DDB_G0274007 n=1 Tax=Neodiprion fabricii TaxID=2872261 RepID=UPI001ED97577|nr:putative cyclin-dependent serine/threonine-protein kinase DDB_G0272797/DDB_G0274007 [Neodiprion fabricii]